MKHVYTIEDLRKGALPANTKLAVIGYPVSHSASPQMHQAALDALDLDMSYVRVEVRPGEVSEVFSLMQSSGFLGCNVTIPHKLEAMECCDELSASVELLGVANTIHFKDGKILGDNSDGPGLVKALEGDFGISLKGLRVLILGAGGGAGKAIVTQLNQENCRELYLSNRTKAKVEELAQNLADRGTKVYTLGNTVAELSAIGEKVDIIINATSMGMKQEDELPFPVDVLAENHKVYDAIYNPAETKLLANAKSNGSMTANGLSMLIYQGAVSFKIWTGVQPDIALMRQAILT